MVRERSGPFVVDEKTSAAIKKHIERERIRNIDPVVLENAVRIMIPSFSNGDRERATKKERLSRLRKTKQTGYDMEPFNHLNLGQLCNYSQKLSMKLRREAGQLIPEVLVEIDAENRRLREEAYFLG